MANCQVILWDFSIFSVSLVVSDLDRSISMSGSFFTFLMKNWLITASRLPNPIFYSLTFLTSLPWMALTWHVFAKSLRCFLTWPNWRVADFLPQTRCFPFPIKRNFVFIHTGTMRDEAKYDKSPNIKTLTCLWRHRWLRSQPFCIPTLKTIFRAIEGPSTFLNRSSSSRNLRGEGEN